MLNSLYSTIGGVPEHFNIPIKKAIFDGVFARVNIELEWIDYYGGTGEMTKSLIDGKIDIAILLTEGAIKFIDTHPEYVITNIYVNSPLNWGIYANISTRFGDLNSIVKPKFLISRLGSGSHLMAFLVAQKYNWILNREDFVIIDNLSGAVNYLQHNDDALFMWESTMTKPYADSGTIKYLESIDTPWASFCIVSNRQYIKENEVKILQFHKLITDIVYKFKENTTESIDFISNYHDISIKDLIPWMSRTEWKYYNTSPKTQISTAIEYLHKLNLITNNDPNYFVMQDSFYQSQNK